MQNVGALLQQAQMMQKKMQEVENKLKTIEVEGQVNNGIVKFSSSNDGSSVTALLGNTRTIVDASLKNQRFKIENAAADVNTIKVIVYQSSNSSVHDTYSKANNILDVGENDKIFFVDEMEDETYEVFFGDGVLGRKLEDGEVVEISYIVTNGSSTNGARTFTFNGILEDDGGNTITQPFSATSTNTISNATGGADIESIEKIIYRRLNKT